MLLFSIALMTLAALLAWLFRGQRANALLVISIVALYALQPAGLEIALPVATLLLMIGVWWLVTPSPSERDIRTLLLITVVAAIVPMFSIITGQASTGQALSSLAPFGAIAVGTTAIGALVPEAEQAARRRLAGALIIVIIGLLFILKTPILQLAATNVLSQASGQAILPNWQWLGFSYIAFRLMHMLIDYRNERLKPVSLRDMALYVVFFPAIAAGPIDRVEHFAKEIEQPRTLDAARFFDGVTRLSFGLFKKFGLADTLAYIALSPQFVAQMQPGRSPVEVWIMVYAYAFRLYLDFAGYSDIAIGIGKLAGIDLPENFTSPYTKRNIAAFWNSWHITLTSWIRNYFFTPFSRFLMKHKFPRLLIILLAQVCTMILIGLWHGVALNFVLWGVWHGVGLWLHRWLVDRNRSWDEKVQARPRLARAIHVLSVLTTFHFVAIGWIFFVLPDFHLIARTLAALVGLR